MSNLSRSRQTSEVNTKQYFWQCFILFIIIIIINQRMNDICLGVRTRYVVVARSTPGNADEARRPGISAFVSAVAQTKAKTPTVDFHDD